jgi:heme-binding protein
LTESAPTPQPKPRRIGRLLLIPIGADRLTGEISRQVDSGQMPPANYIILHPDASLAPDEKQQLIDGLVKSIQQTLARSKQPDH